LLGGKAEHSSLHWDHRLDQLGDPLGPVLGKPLGLEPNVTVGQECYSGQHSSDALGVASEQNSERSSLHCWETLETTLSYRDLHLDRS
jgi:hypothetical protein